MSLIPASNPAGNNQTSPGAGGIKPMSSPVPIATPGNTQQNPFVPITPGSVVPGAGTATVPGVASSAMQPIVGGDGSSKLSQQEVDIYGQGIGQSITDLLSGIGGVNSATLQEYIQSLVPQEAKAQANLDTSLGAAGVSQNSSVAALGEANLQASEFADISGEAAKLTQSGQELEASILTGQQSDAAKEVASSGWDVFSQAIGDAGSLFSDIFQPVKV